ncbi:hypothetical protein [Sphingosinicella rhizophila]|uniref:Uncharacterized protein n=1 Tax=Sphingosinicella rhizophila TaxID=3050082 RepID=A0ABU3Q7H7_9SPHN|nr:hypothetical protein [Sphingosinicella sp. GR2756]MDT9599341.1 hypothetical protein [Sphingosinicella sp. GR2756]
MTRDLHLEALAYCILWVALAVFGWDRLGLKAGLALSVGLFVIIMPTSALILSRTGKFGLERAARWGILLVSALVLASFLDLA